MDQPVATAICPVPAIVATRAAPSTTVAVSAYRRALAGDVPVDVIGGGLGDVATADAASTTSTTATTTRTFGAVACAFGAQAAGIAGSFDAVEEAASWSFGIVKGVVAVSSSSGDDCQTDGLAFCVGTVEFTDCGFGVAESVVGYVGDTFGASGAVVDEGKVGDGSDLNE